MNRDIYDIFAMICDAPYARFDIESINYNFNSMNWEVTFNYVAEADIFRDYLRTVYPTFQGLGKGRFVQIPLI